MDEERGIPRGSDVFLMSTGHGPGLVARGLVSRSPFLAARRDRVGTVAQHITVEWLELLSAAKRIPVEILSAALPDRDWLPAEGAAVALPVDLVARIEQVWTRWHHRPEHRHRVSELVRDAPADGPSPVAAHAISAGRHRRMVVLSGHHPRLDAPARRLSSKALLLR